MEGKSPVPLCTLCQGRPQDHSIILPLSESSARDFPARNQGQSMSIHTRDRERETPAKPDRAAQRTVALKKKKQLLS